MYQFGWVYDCEDRDLLIIVSAMAPMVIMMVCKVSVYITAANPPIIEI